MILPVHLLLMRHGQAFMNLANYLERHDRYESIPAQLKEIPYWQQRLTPKGVEQAQSAGEWIRGNLDLNIDWVYVSSYIRAIETYVHTNICDKWKKLEIIRERHQGDMEPYTWREKSKIFSAEIQSQSKLGLFGKTPHGESHVEVIDRFWTFLNIISHDYKIHNNTCAFAITHGETMRAGRIVIENILASDYDTLVEDPDQRISNCQIIHYTRQQPNGSEILDTYQWMRIINPLSLETNQVDWKEIPSEFLTAEQAKSEVNIYPMIQFPV